VPKFGMKVPHLRCDSHTSFKVKRQVRGGRGHIVLAMHGGQATLLVTVVFCLHAVILIADREI